MIKHQLVYFFSGEELKDFTLTEDTEWDYRRVIPSPESKVIIYWRIRWLFHLGDAVRYIKRIHFDKRLIKMDSYLADLSLVFIKKFNHFRGA
ncbi:hypothetical protein [Lysinibacillus sp. Bpr_S20]|uniref:hypothetical protein n=1 Tax=Lysinibacillus sp. Bpr_S20 TaxID=2933964 RepID=UPI00201273F0|nr:hypothetical protein [Lysinibacillus sp. Bpr_S20]MCL1701770.1 hypothetical protein [Lysinibacillus sp. Bpr_S20]